ncbi:hypothetical protein SDC9_90947 [bioreactor metagenome]|uniref:Uncharacterized protein n=1 Tax=bioreactor metagenome TaxID=1076179 RepID=A0A644ZTD7_9ZZZZ
MVEAALRNIRGVPSGDGDNRHVQRGVYLQRAFERWRAVGGSLRFRLFIEQLFHLFHRRGKGCFVPALHGDKEVVGRYLLVEFRRRNADIVRYLNVQVGTHADQRFRDPRNLLELFGDEQQGHGVVICVFTYFQLNHFSFSSCVMCQCERQPREHVPAGRRADG